MADMFDLELHEDETAGQDNCCESDDDIIEIDDVSALVEAPACIPVSLAGSSQAPVG